MGEMTGVGFGIGNSIGLHVQIDGAIEDWDGDDVTWFNRIRYWLVEWFACGDTIIVNADFRDRVNVIQRPGQRVYVARCTFRELDNSIGADHTAPPMRAGVE